MTPRRKVEQPLFAMAFLLVGLGITIDALKSLGLLPVKISREGQRDAST